MGKYSQDGLHVFLVCVVDSCKQPLFEILFDEELRQIYEAAVIKRDPPQNITIVARKRPIRGHGFSAEAPLTPLAALGVHETSVPRQIILGLRMAVSRKPVRTCVDNWLNNRIFKSYDDIVALCCEAWNKLIEQPWKIMSIGQRKWAMGSN